MDIIFVELPRYGKAVEEKPAKLYGHLPNLGLCSLAAVAEREGYRTEILDAAALQLSPLEVVREISEKRPRYVGLTAMTHSISSAALIARLIKEKMPEIKVILGGVHVTAVPSETLRKYPGLFDVCVLGEGELTLIELLSALEGGKDLVSVAGLAVQREGEIVKTAPREFLRDMDSLPMPAWHLLPDMKKYYGTTLISAGKGVSNHLLTSRGCPGRCIFCDTSVNGHKLRSYSVDYTMEMIDILHKKYKADDIQINDDTFVTFRKNLQEICKRLIAGKYNLTWSCDARASDVNEESLRLMKAAGCWQIAYGVETGSPRILEFIKKNVSLEQIRNAFAWTKKAGISTKGFFIMGHPTETEDSIRETIDLMLSLNIDVVGLTFFTVFPGSPIYSRIGEYGRFDPDWDRMDTYDVGNFIPHGFTAERLVQLRKEALRRFYLRPRYVIRQLSQIRNSYDLYRMLVGGMKIVSKNVLNI
ncbi:MAG: radical SAM protein [Syntrophaceae bacterium]